jgi:hypothetical protein
VSELLAVLIGVFSVVLVGWAAFDSGYDLGQEHHAEGRTGWRWRDITGRDG